MADPQLLKGILEGCVLAIIAQGETYGYEILSQLTSQGLENLGEGTLYPVLTRLHKQGYLSCRAAKSPLGPVRKYYQVSPQGLDRLQQFKQDYLKLHRSAHAILFEKEDQT